MRIIDAHTQGTMSLSAPVQKKRSTNVSLNAALVDEARKLKINLSATLNAALEEEVRLRLQAKWREENQTAIAAMNKIADEHDIPQSSDGLRVFR